MAEYKVIYRNENPGYQPTCPLAFCVIQVSRNTETSQCYLQAKIVNVSTQTIGNVSITYEITSKQHAQETITHQYLDADIAPGKEYQPKAIELNSSEIDSITAKVTQANNQLSFPEPKQLNPQQLLKLSPKAKTERDAQISEHKTDANLCKYIHENYSSWWRCTCGAINFDRANCHKCNLGLDILPALECESELVEKYNEKKSKLKAAALKRKRKSIKIVVIITAIIILLAAVIGGGYMASQTIIPDIRYSGKYDYVQNNKDASNEQTKEYLTELADADYKDSKDIYSELYAKWNIEISFTRSSKKDYLKMKYTLKQSDATLDTSAAHMQGTLTFTYEDNSTEVKKINYALSRTNDDETKQVLVDVDNVSNIKKIDVDATLDDGTKVSKTFSF